MSTDNRNPAGVADKTVGRGVDALFGIASIPSKTQGTSTWQSSAVSPPAKTAEVTLDQMLSAEVKSAVSGTTSKPAGEGVLISDADLLSSVDVPLGAPAKPAPARPAVMPKPGASLPPSQPRGDGGVSLSQEQPAVGNLDSEPPQSPFSPRPNPAPSETPRPQRTPEEEARILSRIDEKRMQELHAQIDDLYRDIPIRINNRSDLSGEALDLLRQARTILIEHPDDFVDAEYKARQAAIILNRIETTEAWGDKYGWRVFWYEVIVLMILIASFLSLLVYSQNLVLLLTRWISGNMVTPSQGILTAVGFWATFVWGGIGGAVGALYILWTHVSQRQDFERQHVMWYIVQPIMGLVLGGVTFLLLFSGLVTLQASQPAATALTNEVQLFPCLIAFIAGFRPQFIFGLLTKIIKVINPMEERVS